MDPDVPTHPLGGEPAGPCGPLLHRQGRVGNPPRRLQLLSWHLYSYRSTPLLLRKGSKSLVFLKFPYFQSRTWRKDQPPILEKDCSGHSPCISPQAAWGSPEKSYIKKKKKKDPTGWRGTSVDGWMGAGMTVGQTAESTGLRGPTKTPGSAGGCGPGAGPQRAPALEAAAPAQQGRSGPARRPALRPGGSAARCPPAAVALPVGKPEGAQGALVRRSGGGPVPAHPTQCRMEGQTHIGVEAAHTGTDSIVAPSRDRRGQLVLPWVSTLHPIHRRAWGRHLYPHLEVSFSIPP